MPDASIIEANRALIDFGAIGILAFFVILYAAFATKQWIDNSRDVRAEKDKRLEDMKAHFAESAANRQVTEANTNAIKAVLDFVKREA